VDDIYEVTSKIGEIVPHDEELLSIEKERFDCFIVTEGNKLSEVIEMIELQRSVYNEDSAVVRGIDIALNILNNVMKENVNV
jgi:hypothetical protein